MAGFTDTEGGGGGGGGGGFPGGGGGGGGDTWSDAGILGSIGGSGRSEDPWDSSKAIAALTGISKAAWKQLSKAERKAVRHQAKAAYVVARERRQGDAQGLAKALARFASPLAALQRSAEFWAKPSKERSALERAAKAGAVLGTVAAPALASGTVARSTVPAPLPGGTQRPPGPLADDALVAVLETIQALKEWWAQLQAQRQAERDARRERAWIREMQRAELAPQEGSMSLGDTIAGLGSSITSTLQALAPVASAIYAERAARSMARSASGVPVASSFAPVLGAGVGVGASAAALEALLGGQPGAMEEGGILEALESDIEREVSLWRRASGGQVHPVRNILARHPQTGAIRAWEYRGQPVLYSGDLAVCKRVNKIARRSAARMGLRFRSRRRR